MSHSGHGDGSPSNLHPNTKRLGVLAILVIVAPVLWGAIREGNWGGLVLSVLITDVACKTLWRWS
jgi:hypothetical protein